MPYFSLIICPSTLLSHSIYILYSLTILILSIDLSIYHYILPIISLIIPASIFLSSHYSYTTTLYSYSIIFHSITSLSTSLIYPSHLISSSYHPSAISASHLFLVSSIISILTYYWHFPFLSPIIHKISIPSAYIENIFIIILLYADFIA